MELDRLIHHHAGFAKTSRVVVAAGVIAAVTLVASTLACSAKETPPKADATTPTPIIETAIP